jgi:tetratricopeptide (TPR) repeat protein
MSDLALLLATRDAGAPTSAPLEDAESLLQQASDLSRRHYGVETLDTLMRLYNLADVVRQRGRHADAVPRFEEIVHVGSRSLAPGHWLVWYARCALGECLTALNRFEDAERHLLAARADCRRDGGDVCDYAAAVEERLVLLYEAWGKPDRAESHRRAARVSTP